MDSDVLLGCTQLFLERKGKRIRSYKVDLMHKNVNFFKEWELIQEEHGWMRIKNTEMDYYLELSNTGEPTVKSKLFISTLSMCWKLSSTVNLLIPRIMRYEDIRAFLPVKNQLSGNRNFNTI